MRAPFTLERRDRLVPAGVPDAVVQTVTYSSSRRKQFTARIAPHVPDMWVRQKLGAFWMAAIRVTASDERWRVSEVRIFPNEPLVPGQSWGEWSGCWLGVEAPAPRKGLTSGILKSARPHGWLQMIEEYSAAWGRIMREVKSAPPRPRRPVPSAAPARGRPPLSDTHLAVVADAYVQALAAGGAPAAAVAAAHGVDTGTAKNWIFVARRRGFLTTSAQGRAGGQLTPLAKFVLARLKKPQREKKAAGRTARPRKGA